MLATVTLPDNAPTADGEKVTFSTACCPGERIRPLETPLAENFAPETLTPEMVTLELPALVSVTLWAPLAPAVMFPKFKVAALELRSAAAATPVPLTETVLGVLEALLMTDTLPLTAPVAFGANTIVKVDCLPAATVMGSVAPVIENPLAVVLACVTVRAEPPGLDTVTDCETVPPTATDPKFTDAGATEIAAAEGADVELAGFDAPVSPIHPEIERVAQSKKSSAASRAGLRLFEVSRGARASAPPHITRMNVLFIARIVLGGKKSTLLYARTDEGQAYSLTALVSYRSGRF